jgi:N-acetyltransferase
MLTSLRSRATHTTTYGKRNGIPLKDILNDPTTEPDSKRLRIDAEEKKPVRDELMASIIQQVAREAKDIVVSSRQDTSSPPQVFDSDLIADPSSPASSIQDSPPRDSSKASPGQMISLQGYPLPPNSPEQSSPHDSSALSSPEKKLTPPMKPPKSAFRFVRNQQPVPKGKVSTGEKRKRQATIDCGQDKYTTCKECQLLYSTSNREDKKRHTEYHSKAMEVREGLHLGPTFGKNVADEEKCGPPMLQLEGQVVFSTLTSRPAVKNQVLKVLEVVTRDLGAVEISKDTLYDRINLDVNQHGNTEGGIATVVGTLWDGTEFRYKSFLHVREGRCIGFLLAERIFEAHRAVTSSGRTNGADSEGETNQSSSVTMGDRVSTVIMGVSRIWVAKDHRRKGIAKCLMENARSHFKYLKDGRPLKYSEIAFSQPTESGMRFAESFVRGRTDGDGWLVYETS